MDAKVENAHPFDVATRVEQRDGRWQGATSDDYHAFVGQFGGATAATLLRALMMQPERAGDPLAFTVNFCAPIAPGSFELTPRLIKATRSTQHWGIELTQPDAGVAAFATAVFAQRRETWTHRPTEMPQTTAYGDAPVYSREGVAASWVRQFEFRFVENEPSFGSAGQQIPASPHTKSWIGHSVPRTLDLLSLSAIADAFFARIFHVRGELLPIGTVSMTTYFHVDAADLANEPIPAVLGVADANVFHKSFSDQTGELWSPSGKLLATTHQITYFKA
ncbi:thioesterase family protein [Rhodopseudomonas sp. HC1]|uniref:acyl-CoA thioesterase n=1 Tax=Rhodopseudomonas infernalis TaxID=2897386 RepID=UPI001EE8B33B|nr:thioesterase family protein [Rhodopseudomonas infernalis]MCG6207658.1 thioesterase family protein [Rhodopseudomonas infernalis]